MRSSCSKTPYIKKLSALLSQNRSLLNKGSTKFEEFQESQMPIRSSQNADSWVCQALALEYYEFDHKILLFELSTPNISKRSIKITCNYFKYFFYSIGSNSHHEQGMLLVVVKRPKFLSWSLDLCFVPSYADEVTLS